MNKPVYDHQSLDALVLHAYYVAKHLGPSRTLGHNAAAYVQQKVPGETSAQVGVQLEAMRTPFLASLLQQLSDPLRIAALCSRRTRAPSAQPAALS